jgi:coniferyl-aldehyde dehydrogenase
MCVSVDYVMVPEGRDIEFAELVKEHLNTNMPDYAHHKDTTGIINVRHKARLLDYLDDAKTKGAKIISIGGSIDSDLKGPTCHLMPFIVVLNATEDMDLMKNEIFGPILPIITYQDYDSAISYINNRDRPLGIYAFTHSTTNINKILNRTVSGGACVNVASTHAAISTLPFGGIGNSGSGRHHGYEGFLEFSNPRAVFERGENDIISVLFPPYGKLIDDITST